MPRILYVVNIPRFFVTHRLPLALAAQQAGYDVHVTTSDADTEHVQQIQASGLPYIPLKLAQHGTNPLAELNTLRQLITLYRDLKPDIVHQVSIKPVIYGGIAARIARVPAVVSAMSGLGYVFIGNGAKPALIRGLSLPAFRLALAGDNTRMIFQNPDDQEQFIRLKLVPPQRSVLIRGSGVDISRFTATPERDGLPVVLFAGRLMWKKGLGDFVEVARQLKGQARFQVAGYAEATSPDNVSAEQLQAWADDGLIEWLGKRDGMPQVFADAHIVCLPSTYGEGVPKVLIEAAASGRAIVTTDTAGCREIVRHDVNGLLVPPSDTPALTTAIQSLIHDPERRARCGQAGRTIAVNEFSLEQVVKETFAVYESLLQR